MKKENFKTIVCSALRSHIQGDLLHALIESAPIDFEWNAESVYSASHYLKVGSTQTNLCSIITDILKHAFHEASNDAVVSGKDGEMDDGYKRMWEVLSWNKKSWPIKIWHEIIGESVQVDETNNKLLRVIMDSIPDKVWRVVSKDSTAKDLLKEVILNNNDILLEKMLAVGFSPYQEIELNSRVGYGGPVKVGLISLSQSEKCAEVLMRHMDVSIRTDKELNEVLSFIVAGKDARTQTLRDNNGVCVKVLRLVRKKLLEGKDEQETAEILQKWMFNDLKKLEDITEYTDIKKEWLEGILSLAPKKALTDWRNEAGLNPLQNIAIMDLEALTYILSNQGLESDFSKLDADGLSLAIYALINSRELKYDSRWDWRSIDALKDENTWRKLLDKMEVLVASKNTDFLQGGMPFGMFKYNGMPEFTTTSPPKFNSSSDVVKVFRNANHTKEKYDEFINGIEAAMNKNHENMSRKDFNLMVTMAEIVKNPYTAKNGLACPWSDVEVLCKDKIIAREMEIIKITNMLQTPRLSHGEGEKLVARAEELFEEQPGLWNSIQSLRGASVFWMYSLSGAAIRKLEAIGEAYLLKNDNMVQNSVQSRVAL